MVLHAPPAPAYTGQVLDRLLTHACVTHGTAHACLLAGDRPEPEKLVAVAGRGAAPALGSAPSDHELPPGPRVALAADGRWLGVLALGSADGGDAPDTELSFEVGRLAACVLDRASDTAPTPDPGPRADALTAALGTSDQYTEGHCQRVAALACDVGRELGLGSVDLMELEFAARLHDVGKLRVPTEILDKPGPLDPHERAVVMLHPGWGAEMVSRIAGLEAVSLLVRLHHERMDGDGYPHGLEGDRIPIASRIVSVCDAYSAIVDDRPYRRGQPSGMALAELRRSAGTQFDPDVVAALDRTLAHAY